MGSAHASSFVGVSTIEDEFERGRWPIVEAVARVRSLVEPVIERGGAALYDIEHEAGVLRILVDRPGGIDVDTIGELTHEISALLDEHDPLPDQGYLLEVSSPGIERKLRTPEHFRAQLGNEVSVKVRSRVDGRRRLEAVVASVDDEGVDLSLEGADGPEQVRLSYDDIEAARTVFRWGEDTSARPQSPSPKTTNKKAAKR